MASFAVGALTGSVSVSALGARIRRGGTMMIAAGLAMAASLTWFWRAELVQRDALGNRTRAG